MASKTQSWIRICAGEEKLSEDQWLQFTALAMVAILVAPAALRAAKGNVILYAAAWLAALAALVWGYELYYGG